MSTKNFVSNGDAETLFTGIGNKLSTLKSGLTNVQSDVKLNTNDLTTPSRTKNLGVTIPTASISGIDFTAQNDGGLKAEGIATAFAYVESIFTLKAGSYILSKGDNADGGRITVSVRKNQDDTVIAYVSDLTEEPFTLDSDTVVKFRASILSGKTVNSTIYPMIRLASVSDPTFAPYIPSVESRIEAVESGIGTLFGRIELTSEPLTGMLAGWYIVLNLDYSWAAGVSLWIQVASGNKMYYVSQNTVKEISVIS